MKEVWTWIQAALAVVGGALGWYFGGFDGMLYALIAFAVLDFILGLLRHAFVEENVSSDRRLKRAVQKVLIFVLVGVANIVDNQVIGEGNVLRNAVVFFYLSSEGVSILEHAAALGLPIPDKLRAILQELHQTDEERNTDYAELKQEKQARHARKDDESGDPE
ncbi:phage holin family protein [Eubacteriales bacterium OttesenSCG-928-A19]|nr:phage holin family protein [Eubacteriales bacterium OttesenSCG-928-A19]